MKSEEWAALSTVSAIIVAALLSPFVWLYNVVTFEEWRFQRRSQRARLAWDSQYEVSYQEKIQGLGERNPIADAEEFASAEPSEKEQLWSQFRSRIDPIPEDPELYAGPNLGNVVYLEWRDASRRYNIAFRARLAALAVRALDDLRS